MSLPSGFTPRDLQSREALRDRFDRGLRALDSAEVMAGLDRFHRQAAEILLADRVRAALDLAREPAALRDDYGRTPLGQGVLAARRLIEAGARFVTLGFGGWDTHSGNFGLLRNRLLPPLDKALSTLIRDLASRGLLDETIVVCAGEFGRTPQVNGSAGRDHWSRSMAVLLAGGGFPGGVAYGSTDDRGTAPDARRLLSRRPRRHALPAAGLRPPARGPLDRRAADPDLPRGAMPGGSGRLSHSPRRSSASIPLPHHGPRENNSSRSYLRSAPAVTAGIRFGVRGDRTESRLSSNKSGTREAARGVYL